MDVFQQFPPNQQELALSFGIEGFIAEALSKENELTDALFSKVVKEGFLLVYPEKDVVSNASYLIDKVVHRITRVGKAQEVEKPTTPRVEIKTIGSSYSKWLAELNPTESCLYLADYDAVKALYLYWKVDHSMVTEALKAKGQADHQKILVQMEACMYGFGGKYAADDTPDSDTLDINSAEGKAALSKFGF